MEVSHRSRRSSWGKSSPKFPSIDPPASSGHPPSIFPGPTSAMADLLCDKQSGVGEVFLRLRNRPPFQLLQQSLTRIVAPEPPHLRPSLRRSSRSRFDPTGVPLLVRLWRDGLMRPSGPPCGEMQMCRRHLLSRACFSFSSFHVCLSQRSFRFIARAVDTCSVDPHTAKFTDFCLFGTRGNIVIGKKALLLV